ncbi:MAG: ribosome silencing factor [Clostridiales bacterium]|jgi:ribosome-associated protein|nr:ribosome silencing factor [Clostridiales bacterium]
MISSGELAEKIAVLLDNKNGFDIEIMKIEELTILSDYFVICSGTTITHLRALSDEIELKLKEEYSLLPRSIEGYDTGGWILMDYGSVVVHIFTREMRNHYSLERLWADAPRVEVPESILPAGMTDKTDSAD